MPSHSPCAPATANVKSADTALTGFARVPKPADSTPTTSREHCTPESIGGLRLSLTVEQDRVHRTFGEHLGSGRQRSDGGPARHHCVLAAPLGSRRVREQAHRAGPARGRFTGIPARPGAGGDHPQDPEPPLSDSPSVGVTPKLLRLVHRISNGTGLCTANNLGAHRQRIGQDMPSGDRALRRSSTWSVLIPRVEESPPGPRSHRSRPRRAVVSPGPGRAARTARYLVGGCRRRDVGGRASGGRHDVLPLS